MSFKKHIENFKCENCGLEVIGTGFTNHCPRCLWSKHVDIKPGDRKESCAGLMKPVGIDMKNGKYQVIHKCVKCGAIRKVGMDKNDNFEEVMKISSKSRKFRIK